MWLKLGAPLQGGEVDIYAPLKSEGNGIVTPQHSTLAQFTLEGRRALNHYETSHAVAAADWTLRFT